LKNAGKQKIAHEKFVNRIGVAFVDEQRNLQWLDQGFLCAARNWALKD